MTIALNIPPTWRFSDLKLARDPDGSISFDLDVLRGLCVDPSVINTLTQSPEDALGDLLFQLYQFSVQHHGAEDPALEQLISEVRDEERRYSVEDAALIIGRSTKEVRRLASIGKLPHVREETSRGPLLWFRRADLERWKPLPRGRAKTTPDPSP